MGSRRAAAVTLVVGAVVVLLSAAATGCSRLGRESVDLGVPGLEARRLQLAGLDRREVVVAAPDTVEPDVDGQPLRPLVVAVHGYGGSAEQMALVSGWGSAAVERGLVVAFAQGLDASFDAGTCCGPSAERGVDDVGYLRRVIDEVPDHYPVDRDRVFLMGYSNGGMLTYRFLCTDADLLAGAASVAGTNAAGCEPDAPVPFLQISGTDDVVVPVDGGASSVADIGPFEPVTASVDGVAAAMGCAPPATTDDGAVRSTRWSPCADGVTVGLDLVDGGTHGYPMEAGAAATPRIIGFWGL